MIYAAQDTLDPYPSIILVSPEYLTSSPWKKAITTLRDDRVVDRIVVDEAHLVLKPDERISLKNIGEATKHLAPCRILMTATLPKASEAEFCSVLDIDNPYFVRRSTNRPNLRFQWVQCAPDITDQLAAASTPGV
ncbi:hypothetical protein FAUST_11193 [Fusarium austroamericanum]|uniref:Helicase ATP-binding domain-containing protein n=1 Tax=Fusarium austroamericanum TaxID=282268 RepID=A0AAN5Z0V9_FUSAU|nr:hypothetical protein FAUST_11193 [Fusarium austroamericanum]